MEPSPRQLPRWLPAAALASLALLLAGLAWAVWRALPPRVPDVGEAATLLAVPMELPDFQLTDQRGVPFDASRFAGRWSFVFFGYTFCPDVCPNTLSSLRDLYEMLAKADGGNRDPLQVVFVSVDPERDTAARLAEYLPYFHPDFVGVTGAPEQIARLTGGLGVYHARAEDSGANDTNYLVNHSSAVLLLGPDARLRAIFPHPEKPEPMARSFEKIRDFYGASG